MTMANEASIVTELIGIKRLLVFQLLKSGASQKQVAMALGVDQSQISRMFGSGLGATKHGTKKHDE